MILSVLFTFVLLYSSVLFFVTETTDHLVKGKVGNSNATTPFQGVNFLGYYTTLPESIDNHRPIPANYFDESFRIISQTGLDVIRYLVTWESFEKHPSLFIDELFKVAQLADKWKLNVVYTNNQFHISSWLDPSSGYGFPSALFENNKNLPYNGGGASDNETAELWWSNWYNRSISDVSGNDGWTLQAEYLKKIVNSVDNHTSTLGYEILNEPQVYSADQWKKIGNYNTFIASELRKSTNKTIVFDRQLPSDIGGLIYALPGNMAEMAPRDTDNIIFKATLFGVPLHCSYAEARLNTAARTAQIAGIPLWLGEFNVGITSNDPIADINQSDVNIFISKFGEARAWGWSYWIWSFREHPSNVRNYDLVNVTKDQVKTTKYFDYLKNAVAEYRSNATLDGNNVDVRRGGQPLIKDTICPTAPLTKIEGTRPGTDYSKSAFDHPITIYTNSQSPVVLIQGEAYDSESGIKSVEIRLNDTSYQSVTPDSNADLSKWSYLLPLTNSSAENEIIIRVTDNADNIKYHTFFIRIVKN